MTDYWKSTPKYLCRYCDDYVKDTKFERQRHEASDRHQRNVQRHLREVQRKGEREERDKQKAQAEIARLNKLVGGPSSAQSISKAPSKPPIDQSELPWKRKAPTFKYEDERQGTKEDRRKHAEQLAALGVDIPTEFREEDAEPGTWQVVSVRNVNEEGVVIKETKEDEEAPEAKAVGVREVKEEAEDQAEREAVSFSLRKTGTGAANKRKRDRKLDSTELDALFGGMGKKPKTEVKTGVKAEDGAAIKHEECEEQVQPAAGSGFSLTVKKAEGPTATRFTRDIPPILLKKRQAEAARLNLSGKTNAEPSTRFLG